jgi:hypothetical protein
VPRTLTSANSVFTLAVPGVFPSPVNLEGYAVDDQFSSDAVDVAETQMGVDGKMSAGYTPFITPITVHLQADSASVDLFDLWLSAMKATREIIYGAGTIAIPSIGKSFICTKVALKNTKQFPDGKKVLQPQAFVLHCEELVSVPLVV